MRCHCSCSGGLFISGLSIVFTATVSETDFFYYSSDMLLIFWSSENVADSPCTWIWLTVEEWSFSLMCLSRLASFLPCPQSFFSSILHLFHLCNKVQTSAKELQSRRSSKSPDRINRTCLVYHTYLMREVMREECWFMIWKEGVDLFKLSPQPMMTCWPIKRDIKSRWWGNLQAVESVKMFWNIRLCCIAE